MMKHLSLLLLFALLPLAAADDGWTSLFNGKDLTGWKASENPGTFTVKDGAIVARGARSHLFYMGSFQNHSFKDFELSVDVMTQPGVNGGIYIQTEYQESGWPAKGFEIQVNNSAPTDPRMSGSLWGIQDVKENLVKDNVWFNQTITAKGNTITVKVNGKQVVSWTQPAGPSDASVSPGRRIGPGTIALQGRDADTAVYYKNIRIRPLK